MNHHFLQSIVIGRPLIIPNSSTSACVGKYFTHTYPLLAALALGGFMEIPLESLQWEKKTTTTELFIPQLRLGAYNSYYGGLFKPVMPMEPAAYSKTNTI